MAPLVDESVLLREDQQLRLVPDGAEEKEEGALRAQLRIRPDLLDRRQLSASNGCAKRSTCLQLGKERGGS